MLGFFEWLSDDLTPPGDAYDPAVGRPRCKKCGKDAWLLWNGRYSAYCSTECRASDKRRRTVRSSLASLLPSHDAKKLAQGNAFQRAIAAKKAAKDIKAIAGKWVVQRKEQMRQDTSAECARQKEAESPVQKVDRSDVLAQRQVEEAEFQQMQAHLRHVADELAKEHFRAEEEKRLSVSKGSAARGRPAAARMHPPDKPLLLSAEAAALEQAFADELRRQAQAEEWEIGRKRPGDVLAQSCDELQRAHSRLTGLPASNNRRDKVTCAQAQTPEMGAGNAVEARSGDSGQRGGEAGRRGTVTEEFHDKKDYEVGSTAVQNASTADVGGDRAIPSQTPARRRSGRGRDAGTDQRGAEANTVRTSTEDAHAVKIHDGDGLPAAQEGRTPRVCGDKVIQCQAGRSESTSGDPAKARNSSTGQWRAESDEKRTNAEDLRDGKTYERGGADEKRTNAKDPRDGKTYERGGAAAQGPSISGGPEWEHGGFQEKSRKSAAGADDAESGVGRRHSPRDHPGRDSARRDSGTCPRKRPLRTMIHGQKKRSFDKGADPIIPLDPGRDASRLRGSSPGLPETSRLARRELRVAVPNEPFYAKESAAGGPLARKSCLLERSDETQPAECYSSAAPHIVGRELASGAPSRTRIEVLRVAGTRHTRVTMEDLQQLREAACRETEAAMEEVCTCCVGGPYAGTLDFRILSVKNVNSARVSPRDSLHVVVRCQVAEAEWVEKRSKGANDFTWDESLRFPVMYQEYPAGARACVQLWRRAVHEDDVDLFVGEGEIPFPPSGTRCPLSVQLCWNTKLGGTVVDLDCGRLQVVVRFIQRTPTGMPGSPLTQNGEKRTSGAKPPERRSRPRAVLQSGEASSRPHQEADTRRRAECDAGVQKTEAQQPAKHRSPGSGRRTRKSFNVVDKDKELAEARARRRTSTRSQASYASVHSVVEDGALQVIRNPTEKDKDIEEDAVVEPEFTAHTHGDPHGRHGPWREQLAAVTVKKSDRFVKKERCWRRTRGRERLKQAIGQERQEGAYARPAPPSAESFAVSTVGHPQNKINKTTTSTTAPECAGTSAPDIAEGPRGTTRSDGRGTQRLECVSDPTVPDPENLHAVSKIQPRSQKATLEKALPHSVIFHERISAEEQEVLLPVALAQMDDFSRFESEPQCVAPSANLDPCVLIQPWCKAGVKWTHCANRCCRRIVSNKSLHDLFEEEEFRAWGCCSRCQGEMFHTKVSISPDDPCRISVSTKMYGEFMLESFIPLAFPTLNVIWPSSRHLYVAQRFTHVQIQERLRQCGSQRQLTSTLMAPLLKYYVRSDWDTYKHAALRTCVRLKVQQHPRLQLLLAGTGRALLYDPILPDFWEWESEDKAVRMNLVGTLLMELRKEYV